MLKQSKYNFIVSSDVKNFYLKSVQLLSTLNFPLGPGTEAYDLSFLTKARN